MLSMAHSVSSAVRSVRWISAEMSRGHVLAGGCADACEVTS